MNGGVISVAPSPDGAQLAISSSLGTRLWNIAKKEPVAKIYGWTRSKYDDDFAFAEVNSVAISPDGKTIASGGLGFVSLWSTNDQKPVKELSSGGKGAVGFSPDVRWIATAEGGNRVRLWDAKTYRQVAFAHAQMGPLYAVVFHPNSQQLIIGGEGGAQALGCQPTQTASHSSGSAVSFVAISVEWRPWLGRPMADSLQPQVLTEPSAFGTHSTAGNWYAWGVWSRFGLSLSRPMARHSSRVGTHLHRAVLSTFQ